MTALAPRTRLETEKAAAVRRAADRERLFTELQRTKSVKDKLEVSQLAWDAMESTALVSCRTGLSLLLLRSLRRYWAHRPPIMWTPLVTSSPGGCRSSAARCRSSPRMW
eukprot:COSAG01_NODE_1598_length_9772_cov_8.388671_3_plen_109_part_00